AINRDQLTRTGYEHFKRSVSQNYFTWVVGVRNPQFRFLARHTPFTDWPQLLRGLFDPPVSDGLGPWATIQFRLLTQMLWLYATRCDRIGLLERTAEPEIGDPFSIQFRGRRISQDLANSLLEYSAMAEHVAFEDGLTVCELGAGSGRLGYWLLRHHSTRAGSCAVVPHPLFP